MKLYMITGGRLRVDPGCSNNTFQATTIMAHSKEDALKRYIRVKEFGPLRSASEWERTYHVADVDDLECVKIVVNYDPRVTVEQRND